MRTWRNGRRAGFRLRYFCVTTIMKVKYLGKVETLAFENGKVYDVISIEKGWYRIMTELDEDYLFPPELFEIVEP